MPSSYDALVNRVLASIRGQRAAATPKPEREKPLTAAQKRSLNALRRRIANERSGGGSGRPRARKAARKTGRGRRAANSGGGG